LQTELDEVICNKCGDSLRISIGSDYFSGLVSAKVEGGYSSKLISDGDKYDFSLCEKCLVELFATFIHNPRVG
jgi:hypothetical protein